MASLGSGPTALSSCFWTDEDAVTRARVGDQRAAEYLFDRYRYIVERQARLYFVAGADHDDVVQEGMMGLWKAIRDFRTERLPQFAPFAELCITRQIISAVKTASRYKHKPLNRALSLDAKPTQDSQPLQDLVADDKRRLDTLHLPSEIPPALVARLSRLERQALEQYMAGRTYHQVALDMSCGTKRIDNALQRAKKKIRKWMGP